jgi:phage tail tube protein FII
MISVTCTDMAGDKAEMAFKGLSTDTKPTVSYGGRQILNGSSFFEIDTQNLVFYDGGTDSWLEN